MRMTAIELAAAVPVGDLEIVLTYKMMRGVVGVTALVNGVVILPVTVADIRGSVRFYKDVGEALVDLAKTLQVETGDYSVKIVSGDFLLAELPLDLVKSAEAKRDKLTAARLRGVGVQAGVSAQVAAIDAWGVRSASQAARRAELVSQIYALANERVSIDAQLIDLVALIAAGGGV